MSFAFTIVSSLFLAAAGSMPPTVTNCADITAILRSTSPREARFDITARMLLPNVSERGSIPVEDASGAVTLLFPRTLRGIRLPDWCVVRAVGVIMTKVGAANRTEAVAIALRKHLLKI